MKNILIALLLCSFVVFLFLQNIKMNAVMVISKQLSTDSQALKYELELTKDKVSHLEDKIQNIKQEYITINNPVVESQSVEMMNVKIADIINQLNVLKQDKNTTVAQLEQFVNQTIINISKPTPIVKPMPEVHNTVIQVALSNQEKDAIVALVKAEIFKKFIDSGYGTFVDGKVILRKPFFGAEILAGEEKKYIPE